LTIPRTVTAAAAAATAVELEGVDKSFPGPAGTTCILAGADLTVARGEMVAVAGRSGSGKTTLLTLIAGLEPPDAGSIRLLDGEVRPVALPWSDLAILPQSLGLLDELTVVENITLPLRLDRVSRAADPVELMARLGVDHLAHRHPSETSLGEQQRVALARAAVVAPRVLLADEPISHQNHTWARTMMALLEELTASGTACLLATHNEVAFESAQRVLHLRGGRLHTSP
jgi:putative ABC transport system ATP-binding protein